MAAGNDNPTHADVAAAAGLPADDPQVQVDLERLAAERKAEPGWHPCEGQLRWWDGEAWTHQWKRLPEKEWSGAAQVGMLLALFVPIIGFLVGLALIAGRDRHGHWVVLTSIAVPFLVFLLLLA